MLLKNKLKFSAAEAAPSKKVIKRFQRTGFEAFWVGGSVRDLLLGRKPKDFDVATNATPKQIAKLFPKHLMIGKKFGIIITTEFRKPVEIASFRKDLTYHDGRRPSGIRLANMEEDVKRRDFTINGLLMDPLTAQVIDLVGGTQDLKKKRIRTIGDPFKRFKEDHLRVLRAIRFSAQLGFKIEKATWEAVKKTAKRVKRISAERIRDELIKIFSSDNPDKGLKMLLEAGLLKILLPGAEKMKGVAQSKKFHPEGDVFNHVALVLKALKNKDTALVMAALLHDIEKSSCRFTDQKGTHFYGHETKGAKTAQKIMKHLRFSRDEIEKTEYLIKNHLKWFSASNMRLTRLENYMANPYFDLAVELLRADIEGSNKDFSEYRFIMTQLRRFKRKPKPFKKLITGRDLLKIGIKEGPIIGSVLDQIEEKRLNEEVFTTADAIKWVKKAYKKHITA